MIAVQGPRCDEVLAALGLPTGLDYMDFVDAEWQGGRSSCAAPATPASAATSCCRAGTTPTALWDALLRGRRAARTACPAGSGARDTLRTEMGYPLHGHDLSLDDHPGQARVGWAVGWDKDAFWGRDVAARRARGGRSASAGWPGGCSAPAAASRAASARCGRPTAAEVGVTTSGTFCPTLKQGIALALLDRSVGEGDELVVDVRGRDLPVRVVKPPFVEVQTR